MQTEEGKRVQNLGVRDTARLFFRTKSDVMGAVALSWSIHKEQESYGCTIGPGIELGEYCMVGLGAVVTRSVLPYQLVYGNPAKLQGFVCACGSVYEEKREEKIKSEQGLLCARCNRWYTLQKDNTLSIHV